MSKALLIKPCPHCGGTNIECLSNYEIEEYEQEDINSDPHGVSYTVVCNVRKGGCGATGGFADSKEDAIEKWNCRAQANLI
jgi:Lar family restriction alleviation protein